MQALLDALMFLGAVFALQVGFQVFALAGCPELAEEQMFIFRRIECLPSFGSVVRQRIRDTLVTPISARDLRF